MCVQFLMLDRIIFVGPTISIIFHSALHLERSVSLLRPFVCD